MNLYYQNISRSLRFLQETIHRRLQDHFQTDASVPFSFPEIVIEDDNAPFNQMLRQHQFNMEEFVILLLALVPHLQPNFIDSVIQSYLPQGGDFAEIGGVKSNNHRGMLPTGETALFILAGMNVVNRLPVMRYFTPEHFFHQHNILSLESVKEGEPCMSGRIILQQEYADLLTVGVLSKPVFGPDFPAKRVTTEMDWENLVIHPKTHQQIKDIRTWLMYNNSLLHEWGMYKKIKPGYRVLFYGPPGTGKSLTATLLGKEFKKDVYRIDLSQVVSKYIGETEKNLEKVFQKAENKDWILFFDEADALFGKRSNVQNAHDKYANQEVSYLLQRVEDFSGLIILASNYKSNIDPAFIRRFNSVIQFVMPNQQDRFDLWSGAKPLQVAFAEDVDLWALAGKYELTGSAIINVIHYASLEALHHQTTVLSMEILMEGIKREFEKEERVFIR